MGPGPLLMSVSQRTQYADYKLVTQMLVSSGKCSLLRYLFPRVIFHTLHNSQKISKNILRAYLSLQLHYDQLNSPCTLYIFLLHACENIINDMSLTHFQQKQILCCLQSNSDHMDLLAYCSMSTGSTLLRKPSLIRTNTIDWHKS